MGKIGVLGRDGESRCFSNEENWCFNNGKKGKSWCFNNGENGVSATGKITRDVAVKKNRKVLLRGNVGK